MPDPLFRAIDEMPRHAYPFLWADYVELLCLCSRNGSVSSGNLQALRQEAQDVQADDYDDDDHDEVEDGGDVEPAQLDDRVCTRWEDIRRRLQVRATAWQDWPFRLDGAVLTSQFDASNEGHRLYVALLIAFGNDNCHACHGCAGRVGAVGAGWNQADVAVALALRFVPGANGQQASIFA